MWYDSYINRYGQKCHRFIIFICWSDLHVPEALILSVDVIVEIQENVRSCVQTNSYILHIFCLPYARLISVCCQASYWSSWSMKEDPVYIWGHETSCWPCLHFVSSVLLDHMTYRKCLHSNTYKAGPGPHWILVPFSLETSAHFQGPLASHAGPFPAF